MLNLRSGALALAAVSAIAGTTAAAAAARTTPAAAGKLTLKIEKTSKGSVLVNAANGDVAYDFTKGNSVTSCVGGCAQVWPAVEASSVTAGSGAEAKLIGHVKRGGKEQVTYAGHLLYWYADSKPAYDVAYIGFNQFGGDWDAVKASGALVK